MKDLEEKINRTEQILDSQEEVIDSQVEEFENLDEDESKEQKRLKWRIRIRNGVIVILVVIIIILLLKGCSSDREWDIIRKPDLEDSDYIEKVDEDIEIPEKSSVDFFACFDAELTKRNPNYKLGVPMTDYGNYYLQFTIYENGEQVYQTKMCEAKSLEEDYIFSVDLYSILGKGEHKVVIESVGYRYEDLSKTNGTTQEVVITCK